MGLCCWKGEKENINIEVVEMNDYVLPNTALEEGSVQMNAFQHRAYLAQWNKDKGNWFKRNRYNIYHTIIFLNKI